MNDTYSDEKVRNIVREEISGLETDVAEMKLEVKGIGITFEEVRDNIDLALQMLTNHLKVQGQVTGHEVRIVGLESDSVIIKKTVSLHSNEIKALNKRRTVTKT